MLTARPAQSMLSSSTIITVSESRGPSFFSSSVGPILNRSVLKRPRSSADVAVEATKRLHILSAITHPSHVGIHPSGQRIPVEIASSPSVYVPLNGANSIRILFLHPACDTTADIECELAHVDLESLPPSFHYEALSYAWGSMSEKRQISIHHRRWSRTQKGTASQPIRKVITITQKLDVTENLESALKQLRFGNKIRVMWIDAICINQADVVERNAQVRRMPFIYSMAVRVCIWLGVGDNESDQAMTFVDQVLDLPNLEKLVKDPANDKNWNALLSLIAKPWFSRRWVVQELAVSRRATVFCGLGSISWSKLADAITLLGRYYNLLFNQPTRALESITVSSQQVHLSATAAQSLVYATSNLFRRDVKGNILEYRLSLEELMAILLDFYSTDFRDILYSLISLAKDSSYHAGDFNGPLPIDYSKTFAEICLHFVYLTIATTGSIDIICRPWAKVSSNSSIPYVPTWVQLLPTSSETNQRSSFLRTHANCLAGAVGKPIYDASKGTKAKDHSKFSTDTLSWRRSLELIVRGIEVDMVAELGACATNGVVPITWKDMAIETEMENGILSPEDFTTTSNFFPESFWRTIVADRDLEGNRPPKWYHRACEHILQLSRGFAIDTSQLLKTSNDSWMIEFLQRVQAVTWNKRWVTTLGDAMVVRMGLVSEHVQVGDRICILYGCSVPVVLRSCNGCYSFIGECYINGWMDGEFKASGHEIVNFTLK